MSTSLLLSFSLISLLILLKSCHNKRIETHTEGYAGGTSAFGPTFKIYEDWDQIDAYERDNNNYTNPHNMNFLDIEYQYSNKVAKNNKSFDYNKYFFPYHNYLTYDPYDFAQFDGWKNHPARSWGNGRFAAFGRSVPNVKEKIDNDLVRPN